MPHEIPPTPRFGCGKNPFSPRNCGKWQSTVFWAGLDQSPQPHLPVLQRQQLLFDFRIQLYLFFSFFSPGTCFKADAHLKYIRSRTSARNKPSNLTPRSPSSWRSARLPQPLRVAERGRGAEGARSPMALEVYGCMRTYAVKEVKTRRF